MGKRGPAPKPRALRLLDGERPYRLPAGEPVPSAGSVEPPASLDAEALAVWHELAPDLVRQGVLTPWDAALFGLYCQTLVYARRAEEMINSSAILLRARNRSDRASGVAVRNPAMQVYRDMTELALRLGGNFGLTPSQRIALATGEQRPIPGEHLLTQ